MSSSWHGYCMYFPCRNSKEIAEYETDSIVVALKGSAMNTKSDTGERRRSEGTQVEPNFTYCEYLEFTSAQEFRKFRNISPITEEEIRRVDWSELALQLLTSET